jgi:hypothetical protein
MQILHKDTKFMDFSYSGKKKSNHSFKVEGGDYYFNEQGLMVFTEQYHLKRGYCCKNGCKHCPYGFKKKEK